MSPKRLNRGAASKRQAFEGKRMQKLLNDAFAGPPEEVEWSDVMHQLAGAGHPDLPGVFRRIAAHLPHTKAAGAAFFYWAAAEEFERLGMPELLSEVSAGLCRLDRDSYDADAVAQIRDILLVAGCEDDALRIAEHFLPVFLGDEDLVSWAARDWCNLLFELRVGQHLRASPPVKASHESRIAGELRKGLETAVDPEIADAAAAVICEVVPEPTWARAHFDLIKDDLHDEANWSAYLGFSATLMTVGREAWQIDPKTASGGFRGLMELLRTDRPPSLSGRRRSEPRNFLDYLKPAQLEERIAHSCQAVIGINGPKARLILRACALLAGFATRHDLLKPADAAACTAELVRLDRLLDFV